MSIDFTQIPSPCFVIDEALLRKNLERLATVSDRSGIKILLALKGFSMWKVFPIIKEYFPVAAASSIFEARLAFEETSNKVHVYAPAYIQNNFKSMLHYASHITFNSLTQYHHFYPLIRSLAQPVSVGLRINPGYSPVETDLYNSCLPGSRVGVEASQIGEKLPEGLDGLHFHALCDSDSYDLEKVLRSFTSNFGHYFTKVKWVNMGGGHLITSKGYDVDHLVSMLTDFKNTYEVEIILEPGAAFVWETGFLVSTVLDIVESKSIKTAILDVSFAAHMPDCLEMPYKPDIVGATDEQAGKPTYRMGGISCLSGDFSGSWSFEKELKPGDRIVFKDMMHYTMVKTNMFNGVAHPSIGLWNLDNQFILFREFGFEDYKGRLS